MLKSATEEFGLPEQDAAFLGCLDVAFHCLLLAYQPDGCRVEYDDGSRRWLTRPPVPKPFKQGQTDPHPHRFTPCSHPDDRGAMLFNIGALKWLLRRAGAPRWSAPHHHPDVLVSPAEAGDADLIESSRGLILSVADEANDALRGVKEETELETRQLLALPLHDDVLDRWLLGLKRRLKTNTDTLGWDAEAIGQYRNKASKRLRYALQGSTSAEDFPDPSQAAEPVESGFEFHVTPHRVHGVYDGQAFSLQSDTRPFRPALLDGFRMIARMLDAPSKVFTYDELLEQTPIVSSGSQPVTSRENIASLEKDVERLKNEIEDLETEATAAREDGNPETAEECENKLQDLRNESDRIQKQLARDTDQYGGPRKRSEHWESLKGKVRERLVRGAYEELRKYCSPLVDHLKDAIKTQEKEGKFYSPDRGSPGWITSFDEQDDR